MLIVFFLFFEIQTNFCFPKRKILLYFIYYIPSIIQDIDINKINILRVSFITIFYFCFIHFHPHNSIVKMYEMSNNMDQTRRGLWFPHSISKQTPVEVWCTASSSKNHAFFTGGTDGSAMNFMFQQGGQQLQNGGFNGSPQQNNTTNNNNNNNNNNGNFNVAGNMGSPANNGGFNAGGMSQGGFNNAMAVGQAANALVGMSNMNGGLNMGGLQTPGAPQINRSQSWTGSPATTGGGGMAPSNFNTGAFNGGGASNSLGGGNNWGTPGTQARF